MSTPRKTPPHPDIQLIANAVITDGKGRVLLTRHGDDSGERWWLPGSDLEPYEHPTMPCAARSTACWRRPAAALCTTSNRSAGGAAGT